MTMTRRTVALGLALTLGVGAGCDGQQARSGMTDAQLRTMIDSLLPSIAEVSGMEVRRPVQFAMQSRSEVRAFIEAELEDELGPEELDGMERAYKRFGLLPDTLDLRAMLLDLYAEQVVGYYDPASDRLYVLDEATAATAGPVVAHELVHALQDQHTDLDSLVAKERGNDRQMAAQAAAEGQAMLVMLGVQAAQASDQPIDLGALPDLSRLMAQAAEADYSQFPVFERAPRLVKETMLFPYVGGVGFVQALFRARGSGGPPVPFGDLLPQSTEQVMAPEARFLAERDDPTDLALSEPGAGWQVIYANNLGQLETTILLTTHLDEADAARGWDGDRFALLQGPDGAQGLVWYSVWDDAASADAFAGLLRRAGIARAVDRLEAEGRPVVRAVLADADLPPEAIPGVAGLSETVR